MATEEKDVRSVLNDLIETCKDGEQGFRTSAEKAKESSLKTLFAKYASQRADYARELQFLVTQMGGDPATSGHVAGTLHRGWLNLKEALTKNEDKALIDECEAGEDAAVKSYREARGKGLPADVAAVVQRQASGVEEAHRTISDLKHGRTATAGSRL
ncbi:MAG TPA: PA2169 family four-helix-bundle protein [Terriglobia bacterium]|jgi:uncharacterized protein (TIGR02284 family)